jgi:DNA replication protein DnaC
VARLEVEIFDELGYPPFSQPGSRHLFYLAVRIYELVMVFLTVNFVRGEWPSMFGDAKMRAASFLSQLTHQNNVIETDTKNWRSKSQARAIASKK